jgi:streptogrisin C
MALAPAAAAAQEMRSVQTPAEALAQDAAEYARRYGLAPAEAERRLLIQQESVAATERLAALYADRLAGIGFEQGAEQRIHVRLTGDAPVADVLLETSAGPVPIAFSTGAPATREQVIAAMRRHRDAARSIPFWEGMGLDQRTGELVILVGRGAADLDLIQREAERRTGVPVRVERVEGGSADLGVAGGGRVDGVNPADGRRYYCTTGFVVTDGEREGVVTAAHCPDDLTYRAPDGQATPLTFVGGWGAQYQDVQVHVGAPALGPHFYADTRRQRLRPVTGARPRAATRAGDFVCHRGETSGYGCAEVRLTHFIPPGDLCGGPCDPTWVTVAGPACRGGDSGGPVFVGSQAIGIVKGATYGADGRCLFYYYMSVDFLPDGWRLLTQN